MIAPADDTRAVPSVPDKAGDDANQRASEARGTDTLVDRTPRKLVRLSVTIDEAEFDRDIDEAFPKIGREARLPGFRNGKVPRKVLEARIGLAAARDEAIRDAVPNYLAQSARQ